MKMLMKNINKQYDLNQTEDKTKLIKQLLKSINAPENLQGLSLVVKELKLCFVLLTTDFEEITGLTLHDLSIFEDALKLSDTVVVNSSKYAKNWMSERPVYSLILSSHNKSKPIYYQIVVAHFLSRYLDNFDYFNRDENLKYLIDEARALRLSIAKDCFSNLPIWSDMTGFLNTLAEEKMKTKVRTLFKSYFTQIENFFKEDRKQHKTRVATFENFKNYRVENVIKDIPEYIGDTEVKNFFLDGSGADKNGVVLTDCFNELPLIEALEHNASQVKRHPYSSNNKQSKRFKAAAVSSKVAKHRNKTLLSSSLIQPHQLFYLFDELITISPSNDSLIQNVPEFLIALTIWLSIYLGKSVNDILEFSISSDIDSQGINIIDNEFYFSFDVNSNVKYFNENREQNCKFRVPKYWCSFIRTLHNLPLKDEKLLIPLKYQHILSKAVKNFLNRISTRHGMSITLDTLQHLWVRLGSINQNIDLTAFDFAFYMDSKNTRIKRHYICFEKESDIAHKINDAWSWIESYISLFKAKFCFPSDFFTTEGRSFSKPVGSPFCPEKENVQKLVKELESRVTKGSKFEIKTNINSLVNYHNNYVTYISFMLLYSTGYRAIYDPLPDLDSINNRHKLIIITDKDYLDRISTRTIPITDIFLKQIGLYKKHISALIPLLIAIDPQIASSIYKAIKSTKNIRVDNNINVIKNLNVEHGPLFILKLSRSGEIDTKRIEPGWLSQQTESCELATKSGRHFFRSQLSKMVTNNELLDYLLGHAGYGESSQEIKSSFNIQAASKELKPHLELLMEECLWQTIPSMIT
jgi:hypothetical protein